MKLKELGNASLWEAQGGHRICTYLKKKVLAFLSARLTACPACPPPACPLISSPSQPATIDVPTKTTPLVIDEFLTSSTPTATMGSASKSPIHMMQLWTPATLVIILAVVILLYAFTRNWCLRAERQKQRTIALDQDLEVASKTLEEQLEAARLDNDMLEIKCLSQTTTIAELELWVADQAAMFASATTAAWTAEDSIVSALELRVRDAEQKQHKQGIEVGGLRKKVTAAEAKATDLEASLAESRKDTKSKQTLLNDQTKEFDALRAEHTSLKDQSLKQGVEHKAIQQNLDGTIAELRAELATKSATSSEREVALRKENAELEKLTLAANKQAAALEKELAEANTALTTLGSEKEAQEAESRTQVDEHQASQTSWTKRYAALQTELDTKTSAHSELEAIICEKVSAEQELTQTLTTKNSELETKIAECSQLQILLREKDEHGVELAQATSTQIDELERNLNEASGIADEATAASKRLEDMNEVLRIENRALLDENQVVHAGNEILVASIKDLRGDNQVLDASNKALEATHETLKTEVEQIREKYASALQKSDELELELAKSRAGTPPASLSMGTPPPPPSAGGIVREPLSGTNGIDSVESQCGVSTRSEDATDSGNPASDDCGIDNLDGGLIQTSTATPPTSSMPPNGLTDDTAVVAVEEPGSQGNKKPTEKTATDSRETPIPGIRRPIGMSYEIYQQDAKILKGATGFYNQKVRSDKGGKLNNGARYVHLDVKNPCSRVYTMMFQVEDGYHHASHLQFSPGSEEHRIYESLVGAAPKGAMPGHDEGGDMDVQRTNPSDDSTSAKSDVQAPIPQGPSDKTTGEDSPRGTDPPTGPKSGQAPPTGPKGEWAPPTGPMSSRQSGYPPMGPSKFATRGLTSFSQSSPVYKGPTTGNRWNKWQKSEQTDMDAHSPPPAMTARSPASAKTPSQPPAMNVAQQPACFVGGMENSVWADPPHKAAHPRKSGHGR